MIGIFDSGIGGLTVIKEIIKQCPDCQILCFGDNARLPYGTKSPKLIRKWSEQIVEFLLKNGAKIIVVACHTASSLSFDFLKKIFPKVPIFEITTPGIKKAVLLTKNNKIGVLGTPATIKSKTHQALLLKENPNLKVYNQACPLFVPLVEEGLINHPITFQVAKLYLSPLKKKKVDTLILACTHYPLLKDIISKIMGRKVQIVNPAQELAKELRDFLNKNDKLKSQIRGKSHRFIFSDKPYHFEVFSKLCLRRKINYQIKDPFS